MSSRERLVRLVSGDKDLRSLIWFLKRERLVRLVSGDKGLRSVI